MTYKNAIAEDQDEEKGGKDAEAKAIEEAVLKIVTNLDSTAVSAEAMKLTKVGFIDILRKVTQEKFTSLKLVKDHF